MFTAGNFLVPVRKCATEKGEETRGKVVHLHNLFCSVGAGRCQGHSIGQPLPLVFPHPVCSLNADAGIKPRASGWQWEEGNGFSMHMQILSIFPAADWPFEANLQAKSRPNKAIGPNNPIKPLPVWPLPSEGKFNFRCGGCCLIG